MEIIRDIEQGSDEWHKQRLASIGGTLINIIASKGDQRKRAPFKFAGEKLTGVKMRWGKTNFRDAERGHIYEPDAREEYEFEADKKVEQVGLIRADEWRHYSPDGLIGDDGMVEIKVRWPDTWLALDNGGPEPTADKRQRDWGFAVTEREWIDSVNYCPEMAAVGKKSIIIRTYYPDRERVRALWTESQRFIAEAKKIIGGY